MGPYGRQVLRVLAAAKLLGLPYLSSRQIARVLTDAGVPCTVLQVAGGIGSLNASPHSYGCFARHYGDPDFYYNSPPTLGWSITKQGIRLLEKNPMSRIAGSTPSYRFKKPPPGPFAAYH